MNSKYSNKFLIFSFKVITYLMILVTFVIIMSNVNYALILPTRTAAITIGSFTTTFLLMQHIYGNFEIGHKKTKPVFLNTMISVLISNFIAAGMMIVMGIIQFSVSTILFRTIIFIIFAFVVQGVIVYIMAHLGNTIFFKLYPPANVLVFTNNDFIFKKIFAHLVAHDKQYKILKVASTPDFDKMDTTDIDEIYSIGLDAKQENKLIEYCYTNNIKLIMNVSEYNFLLTKSTSFVIDDVLVVEISPKEITLTQLFLKRIIDIVGSSILLLISLPFTIVVGIAIKVEDGGPVFFKQQRLTKNGKVFNIYKFRSMKINAGSTPAKENDQRITKVGKIIRKLRIDELPQAINILKGDISIVGPRPETVFIAEQYAKELPTFNLRLKVKGGLTGYAQIFGKYNTTPEMKLLLDLKYIENFSILEDIKLIFQTLIVFVKQDSTEGFKNN